ncbi:MAG: SRPBCC family protein [Actinobacteria bacterium]|nr:SRPBCC family protein [Actinomycetota bacterium]
MLSVERTFVVDRPVDVVFDYLADFSNTEQWDPGTVSCRRTDDGPLRVGSRFHNVSKFRGREVELEYTMRTCEPATKHLRFVGENDTVTSTDDMRLAAAGDGQRTSITYRAEFDFHGMAKLAQPVLKPALEHLADQTVAQMTEAVGHI